MSKNRTYRNIRRSRTLHLLALAFLFLSLAVPGTAKKKPAESAWAEEAVTVDGMNIDWQDIPLQENSKMKIGYGFKNDNENLYAVFVFNDFKFLSSINSSGMTLWLDNQGKKKRKYGIKFQRRQITPEHFIAILERQHGPLPDAQKEQIKKKKFYTIYQNGVVDKDSETVIPIKVASAQAPAFKVGQTPQIMVYEFRVPLQNVEGQVVGIGTSPGEEIMVGFEWGGMTKEWQAQMLKVSRYRGSAAHGGVSTSMPGADESGSIGDAQAQGPTSRAQAARSSGPKKYTIWVPLLLAKKE